MEARQSIMGHLDELRGRIVKSAIAIIIGTIVAFVFRDWIFEILVDPYQQVVTDRGLSFFRPTEAFSLFMRLSLFGGFILASPIVIYQVWAFVGPALSKREKRRGLLAVGVLTILFLTRDRFRVLVAPTGSRLSPRLRWRRPRAGDRRELLPHLCTEIHPRIRACFRVPRLPLPRGRFRGARLATAVGGPQVGCFADCHDRGGDHSERRPGDASSAVGASLHPLRSDHLAGALHAPQVTAIDYLARLPFPADRFQMEAVMAIDQGASVVVTAPTGSGKTVVAEAAIARAIGRGLRAVYTTPLKALSNQKFADFRRAYGDGRVGLLTGDNAINGSAPIVVMTTEVLRNMMYAASPDLVDVGVVVLDEVHYLQDRSRGAVWEEIIVHLDRDIPLVCLSATIANPEEFATWVGERRGHTTLIVERERPVPLESNYLVRDRWESNALRLMPVFHRTRLNDRVVRMLRSGRGRDHRYLAPRRHETCVMLRRRGLLPAIYFIFSRAGCDAAARTVVERGLRLTTAEEASTIRDEAERRTSHLSPQDLAVLGYGRWLWSLEAGVAAHHAGMVPALKETVEHLFAVGLVRLVFATETLALGINMPARTAVLENLSKFTGESHELLQPGDYTQLTGRAGRRGIDEEGAAVVLHSPHVPFERVAGIAAAGNHPLRSSFKPTYNMVVNLIATYPRQDAERLLDASFAQFHAGRRHRELTKSIATLGERGSAASSAGRM